MIHMEASQTMSWESKAALWVFLLFLVVLMCVLCRAGRILLHPVHANTVEHMEQYLYVLCSLVHHRIRAM